MPNNRNLMFLGLLSLIFLVASCSAAKTELNKDNLIIKESVLNEVYSKYCVEKELEPLVARDFSNGDFDGLDEYIDELFDNDWLEELLLASQQFDIYAPAYLDEHSVDAISEKFSSKAASLFEIRRNYRQEIIENLLVDNSTLTSIIEDLWKSSQSDSGLSGSRSEILLETIAAGFRLTNDFDNAIKFDLCAAEKYYNPISMYRIAILYQYGSDEYREVIPDLNLSFDIERDDATAYFWIASAIQVDSIKQWIDPISDLGWNAISILDYYQNVEQSFDRSKIEAKSADFLLKKYPQIFDRYNVQSHSMESMQEALQQGGTIVSG